MISPTHSSDDEIDHEQVFPFVIHADTDRGQVKFCKNLLLNLFEPGSSPCKTEFPDIRIRRQILDHYVKDIAKITQQYGIYTIGIRTLDDKKYIFQTDDLDLEFSKVFTEYIKNIQYHNSQRANSLFTNEVFAIIYTNINILETTQTKVHHHFKHLDILESEMKSPHFLHFYMQFVKIFQTMMSHSILNMIYKKY